MVAEVVGRIKITSSPGKIEELALISGLTYIESATSDYGLAIHVFRDGSGVLHLYKHPNSGTVLRYVLSNPDPNVTINTKPHIIGTSEAFLTGTVSNFNDQTFSSPGLYFIDFSLTPTICSDDDYPMDPFLVVKTEQTTFVFAEVTNNYAAPATTTY